MAQPKLQPTYWPHPVDQSRRELGLTHAAADCQPGKAAVESHDNRRGLLLATAGTVAGAIAAAVTGNWHVLLAVVAGAVVAGAIIAALMIWAMNNVDRY